MKYIIKPIMFLFMISLLILTFFCLSPLVFEFFIDEKSDYISLTNIGFAVFISLASVLFSWATNIEKEGAIDDVKNVRKSAEYSILTAILFIIGSIIKFTVIKHIAINQIFNLDMVIVSRIGFILCFVMAIITAYICLYWIFWVLYKRLILDRDYEKK